MTVAAGAREDERPPPGTRLRVSIVTLEERGRPPRALCVERAPTLEQTEP